MQKEYLSVKGSNMYLIDIDSGEGYSFSEYGGAIEKVTAGYVLSICKVVNRVDILSILSDSSSDMCEIYFQGKRAIVQDKGINVFRKIPKSYPRETYVTFRIVRPDCMGLTQILVPFKYNCVTFEMLNSVFKGLVWC